MRRAGPLLALVLVVLTDATVLVQVAGNRAGDPGGTLEVTERELRLPSWRKEDSGVSLHMTWGVGQGESWGWGQPDWFDAAKLAALGYDCSFPLTDPSARTRYGKARTKEVFLVLEFEGDAWRRWIESEEEKLAEMAADVERQEETPAALDSARKRFEHSRSTMSRLFVVDAGVDAGLLRREYAAGERFIVTPGVVRLWYLPGSEKQEPRLQGVINRVLVDQIHVPRRHRRWLDELLAEEERRRIDANKASEYYSAGAHEPRYKVRLRYGSRFEPWVVGIAPIDAAGE